MADLGDIAKAFEQFGVDCHGSSPLYERLSPEVARDRDLLLLASEAVRRPIPNLLFAAVRFLLFKGFGSAGLGVFESIAAFRSFCIGHTVEIRSILKTRRVQTNEVGRCNYLMPAFVTASAAVGNRPLALIEVGTSAGLLLNWDRYGYSYSNGRTLGESSSPVQLHCELRGKPLQLPQTFPRVSSRLGIDLHIVDVRDSDERLWLLSLVWPENHDRAAMLEGAIDVQSDHPVSLVEGDGVTLLPSALEKTPSDSAACVFHTAVLNQFSREDRTRLSDALTAYGENNDLVYVSGELREQPTTAALEITAWQDGRRSHRRLARAHPHGRWLEWIE